VDVTTMSTNQYEFRLPDLGEGVHEGQVIAIHVTEGQQVREDAPLMEVETDKSAAEIPCPVTGRVKTIHVSEQQLVRVGDTMITFATSDATAPAATTSEKLETTAADSMAASPTIPPTSRRKPASPSVRRLARELAVELDQVDGSGPGGRVTRKDVRRFADARTSKEEPRIIAQASPQVPVPVARLDTPVQRPSTTIEGTVDSDQYGPIVRQSLSQARRTIATVMQTAWLTIPHVTDSNDADITDLESMRSSFVDSDNPDRRITTLAFVIRAVCRALRKHPILNAMLDESRDEIIFRDYVNIAVGVETPRGLVAPVIRNAHLMGIGELSDHLAVLTHNTRSGAFSVDDTRGATYTISNAGAMGRTRYSTPIIMPGTVACLALGRTQKMPWVVNDEIVPRLIMPLSHSMDHRLVDGGREIPFIGHVIDDLEHPMRFAL